MVKPSLLLALVTASVTGCTPAAPPDITGDNNQTMDMPDLGPPPPDLAKLPYPAGPYGEKVGNTLFPIVAMGYPLSVAQTDSTTFNGTMSKIALADVSFYNPKCTCLVVSIAAEWCGPCNEEQTPEIMGVAADPALCAYEVLLQGPNENTSALAVQSDLDDWTQHYTHDFPVVLPTQSVLVHLPAANSLPTNVIVDPTTMKILRIDLGFDPNASYTASDICGL